MFKVHLHNTQHCVQHVQSTSAQHCVQHIQNTSAQHTVLCTVHSEYSCTTHNNVYSTTFRIHLHNTQCCVQYIQNISAQHTTLGTACSGYICATHNTVYSMFRVHLHNTQHCAKCTVERTLTSVLCCLLLKLPAFSVLKWQPLCFWKDGRKGLQ